MVVHLRRLLWKATHNPTALCVLEDWVAVFLSPAPVCQTSSVWAAAHRCHKLNRALATSSGVYLMVPLVTRPFFTSPDVTRKSTETKATSWQNTQTHVSAVNSTFKPPKLTFFKNAGWCFGCRYFLLRILRLNCVFVCVHDALAAAFSVGTLKLIYLSLLQRCQSDRAVCVQCL